MDVMGGLDILALIFFVVAWAGYGFVMYFQGQTYHLVKVMHRYRLQWIKHMIKRADRHLDLLVVGHVLTTTTLLAVMAGIFVMGAMVMVGYGAKIIPLLNEIPWSMINTNGLWVIKTMTLLLLCLFAFFKLTWVIRQLHYATVLIVAAPVYREGVDVIYDLKRQTKYVTKTATILSNIDQHFISAIRALYFGAAVLSWYIHPLLFMAMTVLILGVVYRREFMSRTLILLS